MTVAVIVCMLKYIQLQLLVPTVSGSRWGRRFHGVFMAATPDQHAHSYKLVPHVCTNILPPKA